MIPVYFTDRDLGKKFPEILRGAGLHVERHADHFRHDTPDEEWLRAVSGRGWIVVTHDQRIRYKPNEKNAVMENGIALLLVIGKARFPELATSFVATEPKIREFIGQHPPPYIAKVYRASAKALAENPAAPGRIELSFPLS